MSRDTIFFDAVRCLQGRGLFAAASHEQLRAGYYFRRPDEDPSYRSVTCRGTEYQQPEWDVLYRERKVRVEAIPVDLVLVDSLETHGTIAANNDNIATWCVDGWIYVGDTAQIMRHESQWLFRNEVEPHFGGHNPDTAWYLSEDQQIVAAAMTEYYFGDWDQDAFDRGDRIPGSRSTTSK